MKFGKERSVEKLGVLVLKIKVMEIIKITSKQTRKTGYRLKKRGFISRNTVIEPNYAFYFKIPSYAELRLMADNNEIDAVKVVTDGKSSYWFNQSQIENRWVAPDHQIKEISIKDEDIQEINKEYDLVESLQKELYKTRDEIIFQIESKAKEVLGVVQKNIKQSKETKDSIIIECPYTLDAVRSLWIECAQEIKKTLNLKKNIIINMKEKTYPLDSMVLDNGEWETKQYYFDNYTIGR